MYFGRHWVPPAQRKTSGSARGSPARGCFMSCRPSSGLISSNRLRALNVVQLLYSLLAICFATGLKGCDTLGIVGVSSFPCTNDLSFISQIKRSFQQFSLVILCLPGPSFPLLLMHSLLLCERGIHSPSLSSSIE